MTTYNSSDVKAGIPARLGVYPTRNFGSITIASNVTLASSPADILNICYIPNNSAMTGFYLWLPASMPASLVFSLQDSLTTTTTYIATFTTGAGVVAGVITMANIVQGVACAQYGGTAVSIGGAPGTVEKVWAQGSLLQLKVTTSASATTGATAINLVYMVEWSPTYQATP